MKRKQQPDYTMLRNEDIRTRYEAEVTSAMEKKPSGVNNVSSALKNLKTSVLEAAKKVLPTRKPTPLRKRCVSEKTKELYQNRIQQFETCLLKNANLLIVQSVSRVEMISEIILVELLMTWK